MSTLQSNIESLQRRFEHVTPQLFRPGAATGVSEAEAEQSYLERLEKDEAWLQAVDEMVGDEKIIFVYGFERGLSLIDLLERYPNRWFFVYEPDVDKFNQAVRSYDLSLLFDHPNLYWLSVGEEQLRILYHMLCSYTEEKLVFVALRHYLENDMEGLRDIKQEFEDYKQDYMSNKFTEDRFRTEWTRNYLYHAADILTEPSIERMARSFSVRTAVVVSSGPSLAEDLEWLKKLAPHVLILTAGSSVQALVKHGIKPHLSVIMDGHPVNEKIFAQPATLESSLFFTSSSYFKISDRKQGDKVSSIMRSDSISRYLFERSELQCLIAPTETVAGTAAQVAAALGAKRIIFAGQDLSFSNNKLYTDGIDHFSEEAKQESLKEAFLKVLNVKGGYNETDISFNTMKKGLESLIRAFDEIEFINSTRHGADIEGAPFKPIEEIYEEVLNETVGETAVSDWIATNSVAVDPELTKQVTGKLIEIRDGLEKMDGGIKSILRSIGKMQEYSRTKPARSLKAFDELGAEWADIANLPWFAPILETLIPMEISAFDRKLPEIVNEQRLVEKSRLVQDHLGGLLRQIAKQLPELQDMVAEALNRIAERTKLSL